jgi:hypothetical protein
MNETQDTRCETVMTVMTGVTQDDVRHQRELNVS